MPFPGGLAHIFSAEGASCGFHPPAPQPWHLPFRLTNLGWRARCRPLSTPWSQSRRSRGPGGRRLVDEVLARAEGGPWWPGQRPQAARWPPNRGSCRTSLCRCMAMSARESSGRLCSSCGWHPGGGKVRVENGKASPPALSSPGEPGDRGGGGGTRASLPSSSPAFPPGLGLGRQ